MTRTPAAPVTPSVLRWAREDAGFSTADLAARLGVPTDRVAAWESGDTKPTLTQLRAAADAFRRPVAFFFTPQAPEQTTTRPPDFRSGQPATGRALRRELRAAQERRDAFSELVGDAGGNAWADWRSDPPATADQARERLGVTVAQVARTRDAAEALGLWIAAFEAIGVLVFQMSGVPVEECRGFAQYDDKTPCIVLNGADAPQARSFTLLHELAHLLDHTGALCLLDEDREVEQRCNAFAAAVLMPAERVRDVVDGLAEDHRVDAVVRQFRVSLVAAALRLRALTLVGQTSSQAALNRAAMLAKKAAERPARGGPAHHVIQRRNLGERYLRTVLDALDRDQLTFADVTYYLESTASTVERMELSLAGSFA